ncbi:MAG: DUF1564 family protein [Spirochaetia bacterium]|nr:DUF1564 family protein [Spirochaetia bacterium]
MRLVSLIKDRARDANLNFAGYVRLLVGGCRWRLADGQLERAETYATLYQQPHQSLIRLSVRLDAGRWLEFSQLCRFHGLSRCRMFVLLLEQDIHEARGGSVGLVGTPTNHQKRYVILRATRLALVEEATTALLPKLTRRLSFRARFHSSRRARDPTS